MAFQPIVDVTSREVFAYEALVRGPNGEGAAHVLENVSEADRYAFDQQCRVAAIRQAVDAGILATDAHLSINFLPNAVYSPLACIQLTLKTAEEVALPQHRLMFEFSETERIADSDHIRAIMKTYAEIGFQTALDDFGSGYAGLSLLADFQTSHIKLDMHLVRGIDRDRARQAIVTSVSEMAARLGTLLIAEGIETTGEAEFLTSAGITLHQGFLYARPELGKLPQPFEARPASATRPPLAPRP
ncbi:diguanylate phosphodiesterase [Pacificimonas flava]|uniref:Diguanylate phosphodiesterase n=3 Tax=Sphingosinicellaceae TaxID=2820280 RepID=A0A219B0W0_9SPHN|nr:EAL domain-containing protein [Pacificimonas flava]MBZ6379712.1 EAL domain-containing protein [Pacificimonas aurantium]OWV31961.1 diguanylate phosphodiesterase [Pacificimonas flava]